jgi:hypothetical protein
MILTATGFPPGGNGRLTCTKIGKRQLYAKGETIHKIKAQNTQNRKQNIQNKTANNKIILKKRKSSNNL